MGKFKIKFVCKKCSQLGPCYLSVVEDNKDTKPTRCPYHGKIINWKYISKEDFKDE